MSVCVWFVCAPAQLDVCVRICVCAFVPVSVSVSVWLSERCGVCHLCAVSHLCLCRCWIWMHCMLQDDWLIVDRAFLCVCVSAQVLDLDALYAAGRSGAGRGTRSRYVWGGGRGAK